MIVLTMAKAQPARAAGAETPPAEGAASAPAPGESGPTFGEVLAGAGGPRPSAKESGDHAAPPRDERRHGDDQTPANGGAAVQSAVPVTVAAAPPFALAAFGHEGYLARPVGENASGPMGAGLAAGAGPAEGTAAPVSTHNDIDPRIRANSGHSPAGSVAAVASSMAPDHMTPNHMAAADLVVAGVHASPGDMPPGDLVLAADRAAAGGSLARAGLAERGSRPPGPLSAGTSTPDAVGLSTAGGMPGLPPEGAAGIAAAPAGGAAAQLPPEAHAPAGETAKGRLDTVLAAGKVAAGEAPAAARAPRPAASLTAPPAWDMALGSTPVGVASVPAPAHVATSQAGLAAGPQAHATNGLSLSLPAGAVAVDVPTPVAAGASSPRQAQRGSGAETKGNALSPAPSPLHPGHTAAAVQPLGSFAVAAEQRTIAGQSVAQAHTGAGKALDLRAVLSPIRAVLSPIVEGVVVRHASLHVSEGASSFRVVLEPKSLGQVVVSVATGSDGIQVLLTPQHADTGTLLHVHLAELVSSLRAGDVRHVQVSVSPRSETSDTGLAGGAGMGFQNQGGQGFYSGGQNPTPWARPETGSSWSAPAAVPTPVTAAGPRSFTRAGASRVDVQI